MRQKVLAYRSRGFSLLELVVALVVISALSGALVFWFSDAKNPTGDAAAKSSLLIFLSIQQAAFESGSAPLDVTALNSGAFDRSSASFTSGDSSSPTSVSVTVDGGIAVGAASTGGDCWAVRLDTDPSPTSPPILWLLRQEVTVCDAASFLEVILPGDGSGTSPNTPTIL